MVCTVFFQSFFKKNSNERLSSGFIKRNHVSIWNWIQKYNPKKIIAKRKKIEKFIVDETLISWFRIHLALIGCY